MLFPSKNTVLLAFKYALVGSSSAAIDLGILFLLVEYTHMPLLAAAIISFCASVANGFLWNKRWTFKNTSPRVRRQYIKFLLTSLVGLFLNIFLLALFVYAFHVWYIFAKILIAGLVFFWNFTANRFWTFREYTIARPSCSDKPDLAISVIIPSYNEESDIHSTISDCLSYLRGRFPSYEIIVVDDGSTDSTKILLQNLCTEEPSVKRITHTINRGKGASVRDGIRAARGTIILFMDADSATPIDELDRFLPLFKEGIDIAIGSRYLKASSIVRKQPLFRIVLGRIGNLLIQALLLDTIKDTQCGFKAFTHPAAKVLFESSTIDRWGFDMEILALAQHMGFSIKEVPVHWRDSESRMSRFRPIKDAHRTLRELLRIKWNLLNGVYSLTREKKSVE